jgi:hypothetical protein
LQPQNSIGDGPISTTIVTAITAPSQVTGIAAAVNSQVNTSIDLS